MYKLIPWNWVQAHRVQLRFGLRMTLVGVLAFAIAQFFTIPLQGLWVVLTAVVVTQMSAGGSLRATLEYIVGTFGGAVYAAVIGLIIPHATVIAEGGVLALTIAPLAFAAALNPSFRVAPFSAVLVLLISGQLGEGPIQSALMRLSEVALGGIVAVTVSLLVLPEPARGLGLQAAAGILERLARVLPKLLAGFTQQADSAEITRSQNEIGMAVAAFQAVVAEAQSERLLHFLDPLDQGPLSRILLRLRHDFVIIGRAAVTPLPEIFGRHLGPPLARAGGEACDFLRRSAVALRQRTSPPPLDTLEASLRLYTSELSALRSQGLTLELPTEDAERLFALGFALEQLNLDFVDLQRCVEGFGKRRS